MTLAQSVALGYLGAGLVRSVFKTRHLRSLEPAGGLPRLVAVYLLCAILWLPLDLLSWLNRILNQEREGKW